MQSYHLTDDLKKVKTNQPPYKRLTLPCPGTDFDILSHRDILKNTEFHYYNLLTVLVSLKLGVVKH